MDVKKAANLVEKTRIIEAMVEKAEKRSIPTERSSRNKVEQNPKPFTSDGLENGEIEFGKDLRLLREAVVQLRLTAERIELDKQIASGRQMVV